MENRMETERKIRAEVNGCHVCLVFTEKPVEGVIDKVRAVLSNAYEERVQRELCGIAGAGCQ
ncbi:MAG: hypothetical protein LUE24_12340 [Lachnospiraceae bacterium]|nr:hypothetical protein [Lachnospiraceae bacterium]